MLGIAKQYGENAQVISGFRTAGIAILQDDFKAAGCEATLCTDDGTAGIHGFVTEPLKARLESEARYNLRLRPCAHAEKHSSAG